MEKIKNREEAGKRLAERLAAHKGGKDILVLALPRGGVPVAERIARALNAPLDVFIVRKLGTPNHPELAMGAIASGGVRVMNADIVRSLGVTEEQIAKVAEAEERELARREKEYRGVRPFPGLLGKTVILVDDGIATGATMRVAIKALRKGGAQKLVAAVPVAPPETCDIIAQEVDELVCLLRPSPFQAISLWYEEFPQLRDEEVERILKSSASEPPL